MNARMKHLQVALLLVVAISSSLAFFTYKQHTIPPALTPMLPTESTTSNHTDKVWEIGPYHDWEEFSGDFEEMKRHLKIFVYPDVLNKSSDLAHIFLPLPNPSVAGNYMSEHMFKLALLNSPLLTSVAEEAHFFFLPFSINKLRRDRRFHTEESISEFVALYTSLVSQRFRYWNASEGADHFFACCHSVSGNAASKHPALQNNAIHLTCSSTYFHRFYISHKDVALPQVWPRPYYALFNPPNARHRLAFFAGRLQNSGVRKKLVDLWGNDTDMDIFHGDSPFPYEQGFKRSKYCLHVRGYEANTARVSDAIHYGCVPVIISNYYDLPFANVLDWTTFSIIIRQQDVALLKPTLLAISEQRYQTMYLNLLKVRRHFTWHTTPRGYDSFYMSAYQLWLRRNVHRLSY